MHYILNGHIPVEVDWKTWALHFKGTDRTVAKTQIGGGEISTVFLGLDHGFGGVPVLFETMVFGVPGYEDYQERYTTWELATAGHNRVVESIRSRSIAQSDSTMVDCNPI